MSESGVTSKSAGGVWALLEGASDDQLEDAFAVMTSPLIERDTREVFRLSGDALHILSGRISTDDEDLELLDLVAYLEMDEIDFGDVSPRSQRWVTRLRNIVGPNFRRVARTQIDGVLDWKSASLRRISVWSVPGQEVDPVDRVRLNLTRDDGASLAVEMTPGSALRLSRNILRQLDAIFAQDLDGDYDEEDVGDLEGFATRITASAVRRAERGMSDS